VSDSFSLKDKVAVVTGGALGIGAAITRCFIHAGAFVYVADIDVEKGTETVEETDPSGGKAEFVALDVSDAKQCRRAAQAVIGKHGRCDILVNNAGVGHVGTILETEEEDLDRLYRVNVKGVFLLTRAILPSMIERRSGSIILMGSVGGVLAIRDRMAYCATKFAVVGMTKALAVDHAHTGVRINCICPGRVETPFVRERLKEYPDPEKACREMTASQPLGRMGKPEEIAAAALYLASDASAFVTGSALMIDGGWSAG
jgi:NAD(P)-dependent dehydrogenase (short-subunit alcohol dehydrogenase family)